MTGRDHQDPPATPPANVPELINDYRAQQEAWRAWESQLARLRNEILATAERDAATIVTTARADIRRILVEARHQLLVLTSQVRAVTEGEEDLDARSDTLLRRVVDMGGQSKGGEPGGGMSAAADTQDRVLNARHDVRRLLEEARPDLEKLSEEVDLLRQRLQPAVPEEQTPAPAVAAPVSGTAEFARDVTPPSPFPDAPHAPAPSIAPAQAPPLSFTSVPYTPGPSGPSTQSVPYAPMETGAGDRSSRVGLPRSTFVIAFVFGGAALLAGLLWWVRSGPTSAQQMPSAAATSSSAPLQTGAPTPAANVPAKPVQEPIVPGSMTLVVEARRQAWIQFTIDGESDNGRLYEAGYTRKIQGARDVLMRVGDAGAVYVSVNGQEPTLLGQDGQIVTRRYTAEDAPSPKAEGQTASETGVLDTSNPVTLTSERAPAVGQVDNAFLRADLPVTPRPTSAQLASAAPSRTSSANEAAQSAIISAGQRWLEAYYQRDLGGMAALAARDPNITDERVRDERLPQGLARVERTFEGVQLELFGDSALFTARMTERADMGGEPVAQTSVVSQVWVRQQGQWRLSGVRLVGRSR